MLNNTELAYLSNALQVPSVVNGILDKQEAFNDETRYAMHEDISDKQPDTALLTIAISALIIANRYQQDCPNLSILKMETSRIIDEYGSLWIKNAQDQELDDTDVYDVLFHTAEDLDSLAELLEYNFKTLQNVNTDAADLCDLLQIQAKAHSLIAEEFIALADELIAAEDFGQEYLPENTHTQNTTQAQEHTNNVITFPIHRA